MLQLEFKTKFDGNFTHNSESKLHYRNIHVYDDFSTLVNIYPKLKKYVNMFNGKPSIDYKNPKTYYEISKILLHYRYNIVWEMPEKFLVPTIPSRANYVHYIADLLTPEHIYNTEEVFITNYQNYSFAKLELKTKQSVPQISSELIPKGKQIFGLDIGIGANSILSILCTQIYSWNMIGTEISTESLNVSNSIIRTNNLENNIKVLHQKNDNHILFGILDNPDIEKLNFCFSVCNPPYYCSAEEAKDSSHPFKIRISQEYEVVTEGGEFLFILKLYNESQHFSKKIIWFTSQVSKFQNLKKILNILRNDLVRKHLQAIRYITLKQGKHDKWVLAWTFYKKEERISLLKFLRNN